jgi:hypothetical protein
MTEEAHLKHLEMIQNVITRMAQNSFALKGWTVTLVAALFALADMERKPLYLVATLLAVLVFWVLDAFFLRQENLFRKLYDATRMAGPADREKSPFSMDTTPCAKQAAGHWRTCWSKTIAILYVPVCAVILLAMGLAVVRSWGKGGG